MVQLAERNEQAITGRQDALLIVDEDANHREIFSRRLRRRGYQVRTAANAAEAVAQLRQGLPSAVVIDLRHPDTPGWDELENCLSLTPGMPVIVHSAAPLPGTGLSGVIAAAHVEKSSDLAPLLAALECVLSRARGL